MSSQQGGSGEGKNKKRLQYGGGWAKHAYGPLHPLSNRRERAVRKRGDLDEPEGHHRGFRKKRDKKKTPRHLRQKAAAIRREIDIRGKWLADRVKRNPNARDMLSRMTRSDIKRLRGDLKKILSQIPPDKK